MVCLLKNAGFWYAEFTFMYIVYPVECSYILGIYFSDLKYGN